MDHTYRYQELMGLTARLAVAVGAAELVSAFSVRDKLGMVRTLCPAEQRIGTRLLPSPIPRVVIGIDPPVDARALCAAWGIERPVAVSGDVHQRNWQIRNAGDELPDPVNRCIAASPVRVGRWEVELHLTGRPAGPLPAVVAGASPAYDILERSANINRIDVYPAATQAAILSGEHADAQTLLVSMASRYPAWRSGWALAPETEFVVVYRGDRPIAGGAVEHDGRGTSSASRFCAIPDAQVGYAGSVLLDSLESVALGYGSKRFTLDESVFLHRETIPSDRHGYVVAPPYDGDADVTVWAERDLRLVLR
jgi:hypothetical protein